MKEPLPGNGIKGLSKLISVRETMLPPDLMIITTVSVNLSDEWDWIFSSFKIPHGIEWLYLLAMGIFATLSQWFITKAYELTKAGIVGVISYSNTSIFAYNWYSFGR